MTETLAEYSERGGHPMVYQDRSLQCCDCSSPFTFSAGRTRVLRLQRLPKRPQALSTVSWGEERAPAEQQFRIQTTAPDVSRRLRGTRQEHRSTLPAPWWQTGLLWRLLQQGSPDQVLVGCNWRMNRGQSSLDPPPLFLDAGLDRATAKRRMASRVFRGLRAERSGGV